MIATLIIIFQFLRSIPWTTTFSGATTTTTTTTNTTSKHTDLTNSSSDIKTTESPLTSTSLSLDRKSDESSSNNKESKDKRNSVVRSRKVSIETVDPGTYHPSKLSGNASTIKPYKKSVEDEEEEEEDDGDLDEEIVYNARAERRSDSSEGDHRDTEQFYQNIQEGTSYQFSSNLTRMKRSSVGQSSVFTRSDSSATNTSSSGSGGTFTAGKRRSTSSSIASDIIPTDRRSSTENSRSSGHRRSSGKIRRTISRVTIAGARRRTTGR